MIIRSTFRGSGLYSQCRFLPESDMAPASSLGLQLQEKACCRVTDLNLRRWAMPVLGVCPRSARDPPPRGSSSWSSSSFRTSILDLTPSGFATGR